MSFQTHSQLQPPCRQLSVLLSHSPGDATQSPVHGDGGLGQPVGSLHHAGHLKRIIVARSSAKGRIHIVCEKNCNQIMMALLGNQSTKTIFKLSCCLHFDIFPVVQ